MDHEQDWYIERKSVILAPLIASEFSCCFLSMGRKSPECLLNEHNERSTTIRPSKMVRPINYMFVPSIQLIHNTLYHSSVNDVGWGGEDS